MAINTSILISLLIWYAIRYVLNAIGYLGQFKKANNGGWKAFIPFYREEEVYRISWNKKSLGWIWLLACVLGACLLIVGSNGNIQVVAWIGAILIVVAQVLQIMRCFHQAHAFGGHGGWIAALMFVNPIANFFLGRSTNEYKGAK